MNFRELINRGRWFCVSVGGILYFSILCTTMHHFWRVLNASPHYCYEKIRGSSKTYRAYFEQISYISFTMRSTECPQLFRFSFLEYQPYLSSEPAKKLDCIFEMIVLAVFFVKKGDKNNNFFDVKKHTDSRRLKHPKQKFFTWQKYPWSCNGSVMCPLWKLIKN